MTSQSDRDTAPAALECQSEIDKDLVRAYYGNLDAFYRVRAALAATPAVGGEARKDVIDILYRYRRKEIPSSDDAADDIISALRAARPASPLRGRESLERVKNGIDTRLNDWLCEMKPNYDDSITGFNEAWDIVRKYLKDAIAASPPEQPAAAPMTGKTQT